MDDDMDFGDGVDDGDGFSMATAVGTGYALFRHGQDRQTREIVDAIRNQEIDVEVATHEEPIVAHTREVQSDDDWDDFIGQEPLKRQMKVYIESARARNAPLPHTLLASGFPGVGKTMAARIIARSLGVRMIELMPPFDVYTLVRAALELDDRDVLFIDEIHKLADNGKRGAEMLLKVLEEGVAFMPDGSKIVLPNITIIGATTDRDKLPEPVLDRFKIKPYYQPYTVPELGRIAITFAFRHDCSDLVEDEGAVAIAFACRGVPRVIEEMILAQRDLSLSLGREASPEELLAFLEVQPDGLTRTHVHYLTAMYRNFRRINADGEIEYIVGEAAIKQILRETTNGIQRVEAFLVERGLIDRTPRGRRLTAEGVARAREFVDQGMIAS